MRNLFISILVCVMWGLHACQPATGLIVPSPIYVDNHYHGPADPEITWNPKTKEWMIFYTSRRPFKDQASYVGTPVGLRDIVPLMVLVESRIVKKLIGLPV